MQDQHPDPTKWKEVNIAQGPFRDDNLGELIEALHGDPICVEEEAYHEAEPFPALECESDDFVERPRMKTDSRRTMQQGPKGNIYPSPKRGH